MSKIDEPAKFQMLEIKIDGEDVIGLFVSIEIFENIFIGGVTGSITIVDSDTVNFIEKKNDEGEQIEFNEPISFRFRNAEDEEIKFEGVMNGLRNEIVKNQTKMYTIDFTSNSVRKNEITSVSRAFKGKRPEQIVKEMVEDELGSTFIPSNLSIEGEEMNWVSGNRKPIDVIRYVLNHGVTPQTSQYDEKGGTSSGTSGFLCWETLDGYRMSSVDNLLKEGNFAETHENYVNRLANTSVTLEEKMKTIIRYNFPKMGDTFEKLRSGAVKSKLVSMDMDTGIMTDFFYNADTNTVTDKLMEIVKDTKFTRTLHKTFSNERHEPTCKKALADTGDQSRKYLSQTINRQNTFGDTHGRITLPPRYQIRAGDLIDIEIYRIQYQGTDRSPQKKHSGKYLISQVGHHFFRDGFSYTKLALVRSNEQQDLKTANK